MTLQIRENLIDKGNGFEYSHNVSLYPDKDARLREDLFIDTASEVWAVSLANFLVKAM